jgi:carbon-monoxide dehydrogenase medium subunit
MLYEFSYLAPASRKDLLAVLAENHATTKILAGGTDLMANIRLGFVKPGRVIDIKRIPEHNRLSWSKTDGLLIGPGVTINQMLENPDVRKHFPAYVKAGEVLASHQLRNRATVVGNLCNASPCADSAPPLLCLGAFVTLSSEKGDREIPLADFFTGVKKTALSPTEYVSLIRVAPEMAGARAGFAKMKRVKGHDLGVLSVCLLRKDAILRVGIGSAAPTPVVTPDLPAKSKPDAIVAAATKAIAPIDDVRGSRDYRLFMTATYIKRLAKEVLA